MRTGPTGAELCAGHKAGRNMVAMPIRKAQGALGNLHILAAFSFMGVVFRSIQKL
jgi:hypothetical protein